MINKLLSLRSFAVVMLLALPYSASADLIGPTIVIEEEFKPGGIERTTLLPVAGAVRLVAALQLLPDNPDDLVNLGKLKIGPAPNVQRQDICVGMSTQDSAYIAKLKVGIEGSLEGQTDFKFKSDYKAELAEYSIDRMFMKAIISQDCNKAKTDFLVPLSFTNRPRTLRVLLKVDAGAVSVGLKQVLTSAQAKATRTPEEHQLDCWNHTTLISSHRCEIELSELWAGTHKLLISIKRLSELEPQIREILVRLPDG